MGQANDLNVIEWQKDDKTAILCLTQGRTITRVMRLTESRSEECRIIEESKDGSICSKVPIGWIKIGQVREVSEERREDARQRMKDLWERNILRCWKTRFHIRKHIQRTLITE